MTLLRGRPGGAYIDEDRIEYGGCGVRLRQLTNGPATDALLLSVRRDTTAGRGGRAMTGRLTWWGHSTSTWQDGGTTVLFDPVLTARLGHLRRVRGPVPPPHAAHADIVLISHLHADHTHLPSLRLIPTSGVLIAPAGSRRLLEPVAARGMKLREVEPGDLLEFGDLQIRVLAADHDGRRHAGSPHRGPALGFLVEGSRRCWYPGDTGPHFEEVAHVDVALVPVGGWGPSTFRARRGHLDAEQAAEPSSAPSRITLSPCIGEPGGPSAFPSYPT